MTDASYTQVTGKLDLIDRREILRTWQNVCIGISCSQCQFYNDDAMSGDCLLERWVHSLPSAQLGQRYTNEELMIFQHGISLSLLSKRSAQHWRYDENTATEIKFLERLYEKVSANIRGGQNE